MYGDHMYFQMTMRTLGLSIQDMVIYKMRRRSVDGLMQKLKFMMALGNGLFAGAECLENTLYTYTVGQEMNWKVSFIVMNIIVIFVIFLLFSGLNVQDCKLICITFN